MAKGRIAGLNMAAEPVHVYDEGTPLNVTRLAGFKITIIGTVGSGKDSDLEGLARGDSETWRELGEAVMVESQSGDAHIRLALADEHHRGRRRHGRPGALVPAAGAHRGARRRQRHRRRACRSRRLRSPSSCSDFWQDWKAHRV